MAAQTQAYDDAQTRPPQPRAPWRAAWVGASLLAQIVDPHFGADDITSTLAFVQAGQPGPFGLDGIFALPIPGAPLGSPYGIRIDPIAGSIGYHPGVDFDADARTEIHLRLRAGSSS